MFDTILKMDDVTITEVTEKKYVVYFKANGHKFDIRIYGNPMAGKGWDVTKPKDWK